jgi:hypothetical protein
MPTKTRSFTVYYRAFQIKLVEAIWERNFEEISNKQAYSVFSFS